MMFRLLLISVNRFARRQQAPEWNGDHVTLLLRHIMPGFIPVLSEQHDLCRRAHETVFLAPPGVDEAAVLVPG